MRRGDGVNALSTITLGDNNLAGISMEFKT